MSHEHRFIFLHCRKAAGSSIKATLGPLLGPNDIVIGGLQEVLSRGNTINGATLRTLGHPRACFTFLQTFLRHNDLPLAINEGVKARYRGILSENPPHPAALEVARFFPQEWSSYFKFCFVRNPYEQILSDYLWRTHVSGVHLSFRGFLRAIKQGYGPARLLPAGYLPNWSMYTIDDRPAVDFIGRFESLDSDVRTLMGHLNLPIHEITYHDKVGNYLHTLQHYYGSVELELVYDLFKAEIDYFSYTPW